MNPLGSSSVTLQQIHDIGGWTFAALALAGMLLSMVKGMVVPRFIYDEQKARADYAIGNQEQILAALDRLSKSVDLQTSALLATGRLGKSDD